MFVSAVGRGLSASRGKRPLTQTLEGKSLGRLDELVLLNANDQVSCLKENESQLCLQFIKLHILNVRADLGINFKHTGFTVRLLTINLPNAMAASNDIALAPVGLA